MERKSVEQRVGELMRFLPKSFDTSKSPERREQASKAEEQLKAQLAVLQEHVKGQRTLARDLGACASPPRSARQHGERCDDAALPYSPTGHRRRLNLV